MKVLKKAAQALSSIYHTVIVVFTFFLFFIVAYNVIRRYVFNNSIAWADELARFLFIWVNLLGIIAVFQNDELIKLDFLSRIIAKKKFGKQFLVYLEFAAVSIVLALLVYYSFQFLSVMNHVSATLALPMKLVYAALPISMSSLFIGNMVKFIRSLNLQRKC